MHCILILYFVYLFDLTDKKSGRLVFAQLYSIALDF